MINKDNSLSYVAQNKITDLKTPPHSIEAEQSVLGGLMLDSSRWDDIADILVPNDFYRKDHRLIFEAIEKLVEDGKGRRVILSR